MLTLVSKTSNVRLRMVPFSLLELALMLLCDETGAMLSLLVLCSGAEAVM